MENHGMKILKYLNSASEWVQAFFFIFLIFVASTVAYFQGYNPTAPSENRTMKRHLFEYMKTVLSGMLAFFFTLLIAESQKWDFPWTCLVGGISVLFSKQFFELLFSAVLTRILGTVSPPVPPNTTPSNSQSPQITVNVDASNK